MEIYLYTFDKKQNSTYFPGRSAGTRIVGQMATAFNVVAPVVTFALPATVAPKYNHAEIPAFGRKYFIDSWNFVAGRWEAAFSIDALATYKNEIGASRLYVLRSSADFDGGVVDMQYPGKGGKVSMTRQYDSGWADNVTSSGSYVVGIMNNAGSVSRVGSSTYYVLSPGDFANFMSVLLGNVNYLDISATELSESLQKAIVNPMQYITSVMWFPYVVNGVSIGSTIPVGWWSITGDFDAKVVSGTRRLFQKTVGIPKHPQTAERGKWVNKSPASTYSVEWYPWGVVPLDSDKLIDYDEILLEARVDQITGVGILRISDNAGTGGTIAESTAQVGVPIQLAQLSMDWAGLTAGNVGVAAVAAGVTTYADTFGNSKPIPPWERPTTTRSETVQQAIPQLISNIGNALNSILAETSVSGSNGSTAGFSMSLRVNAFFVLFVEDDNSHNGRPLCSVRTLSTIPGFILVKDAEIDFGETLGEQSLIRSYLEGGFFYE